MRRSEELDKVLSKILKVKSELQAVSKDAYNPFFKSNYADLNAYLGAVEPLLNKHKLILLQPVEGRTVESVILCSESGQYVSSHLDVDEQPDMQKLGGSITYARRYTLGALLSMQAEDDDGETAVGRGAGKGRTTNKGKGKPKKSGSIDL